MQIRSTLFEQNDLFYIASYGYEDIWENAHWGRGRRNIFILHYVLSGKGYFNGREVRAEQGFLIKPGQMHEYHSSETEPWKYIWVIFDGAMAAEICKKHIRTDENDVFKVTSGMQLRNLRDRLFSESTALSETMALSYFFQMLSLGEEKIDIAGNNYVEAAKKYMAMHFFSKITIAEVAASVGIDDRYLYNLFVMHEHISPKKYLSRLRLNCAKSMLSDTDATISEIAVSSGFPDVLTFSRFFSKNMKQSPSDYRKTVNG